MDLTAIPALGGEVNLASIQGGELIELVRCLIQRDYQRDYLFKDRDEVRGFFTQLTGLLKNLNHAPLGSPEHPAYRGQVDELVKTLGRPPAATADIQNQAPAPQTAA